MKQHPVKKDAKISDGYLEQNSKYLLAKNLKQVDWANQTLGKDQPSADYICIFIFLSNHRGFFFTCFPERTGN